MSTITISDFSFDSENYMSDLTDSESSNINGGGLGALGGGIAGTGGSILDNVFNGNSINWRSAAAWGLAGVVGGPIAGSLGGPVGAGLAGKD